MYHKTIPVTALICSYLLTGTALFSQALVDPSRTTNTVQSVSGNQSILQSGNKIAPDLLQEENAFAPSSPGDSDLGQQLILKRNEKVQPFRFSIDSSEFWTDNAANARAGKKEDWFYSGGVSFSYQPRIGKRFFFDSSLGEHWYRYSKLSELDFESGEASAGLIVIMPELANSILYANYYYNRITQGLGDSPIYTTQSIRVGAQKVFLIDRLQSANVGIQSSFSLETDPVALRRHEYSFNTGYNYKIMRDLIFSITYRASYYDYFKADRQDWYHSFGAALSYQPREWFEIAASYNYTLNRSNRSEFDYDSQLAGPSITAKIRF